MLRGIQDGSIRCLAVDTPVPSQFAHELMNANPYAFLDEAGLEERRTRAVSLRGEIPASVLEQAGKLDPHAIDAVRAECWPDIRDENEMHDLLMGLVALPIAMLDARNDSARAGASCIERLERGGRAQTLDCGGISCWVATERLDAARALWQTRQWMRQKKAR